jgi:hypothetical protein
VGFASNKPARECQFGTASHGCPAFDVKVTGIVRGRKIHMIEPALFCFRKLLAAKDLHYKISTVE